jgi:hypothetical protein
MGGDNVTHFDEIKKMSLEDFAELLAFLVIGENNEKFEQAKENYIAYLQSEVQ